MVEVSDDEEVKKASAFWAGFDLDGRRAELDARALDIADGKEASAEARKQLSRLTSTFRERYMPASARGDGDASRGVLEAMVSSEEEGGAAARRAVDEVCGREGRIWSGAVDLLRAYQEELDALSRRARSSDSAFLSLYRSLYAAPDPANALRRAGREAQRVRELGAENDKLANELKTYDGEFAQLKNQELKIRKLEDALRDAEREADARAEQRAEQRAAEVEREAEARVDAARDRERGLERRLQHVAREKGELEKRLASPAAEKKPPRGEETPVHDDVVAADATERAAAAEREVAMLRSVLKKSARDQSQDLKRRLEEAEAECCDSRSALADSRREANALRDENSDLQDRTATLESALEDVRKRAADDRRELEALRRSLADDDPERTVDSQLSARLRHATDEAAALRARLAALHADDALDPKLLQRRLAALERDVAAARDAARREKAAKDKLARENFQLVDKLRRSKSDVEAPDDPTLDPFAQFEKNERARALSKLTFPEKIAIPLLRHSAARRCAFLYVTTLHFLVFAATIYFSHSSECSPCHCGIIESRPLG
ncbi:hypothetical protein CTAYLR_002363 [Chrysophaeum taylorii]|uniref:Cux N-terminal domain-containing protein n=1 Tax=Chrysophaeum taylorii TaxID=2483200 RepID=A0AAD7XLZ4_9STRA|nr:hypothetical protein CTAYLR_002363 [Chrysophaeum taylorii]